MQLARKLTAKQLPASNLMLEIQSGATVNGAFSRRVPLRGPGPRGLRANCHAQPYRAGPQEI